MLRLILSGLILSTARPRPTLAHTTLAHVRDPFALHSRALSDNTCRKFEFMETPFEKMAEEGVPKCDKPTEVAVPKQEQQKELPKLSAQEFRVYNRMAEHMDMFHENFRRTWNLLYTACTTGKRPNGMSIRAFLSVGEDFVHHLTIHHTIEEQHIFPVLARKMPAFKAELELLTQHKKIHEGLDLLEAYVAECRSGARELRLKEMGEVMATFGGVLWQHLDDEVRQLRAENMRLYWSAEEMRRLPM